MKARTARRLQIGSEFIVPHAALQYGGARAQVTARRWVPPVRCVECPHEGHCEVERPARVALAFAGVDIQEISGELELPASSLLIVPEDPRTKCVSGLTDLTVPADVRRQ